MRLAVRLRDHTWHLTRGFPDRDKTPLPPFKDLLVIIAETRNVDGWMKFARIKE